MTPEMEAIVAKCRAKLEALGLRADEVPEEVVAACVEDPDPLATAIGRVAIGLADWAPPSPIFRNMDRPIRVDYWPGFGLTFYAIIGQSRLMNGLGDRLISASAEADEIVSMSDPSRLVRERLDEVCRGAIREYGAIREAAAQIASMGIGSGTIRMGDDSWFSRNPLYGPPTGTATPPPADDPAPPPDAPG